MKNFLMAWIGTLVLGVALLSLLGAAFGEMGWLLLAVTVVALLIAMLMSLSEEIDDLSKRVKKLEENRLEQGENSGE